jgi:hypothetical protein
MGCTDVKLGHSYQGKNGLKLFENRTLREIIWV